MASRLTSLSEENNLNILILEGFIHLAVDNILLDPQNSSYPTRPHSVIAKCQSLATGNPSDLIGKKNDPMPANSNALENAKLQNYALFFRMNKILPKSNTTKKHQNRTFSN